jgi:hypothetical protein
LRPAKPPLTDCRMKLDNIISARKGSAEITSAPTGTGGGAIAPGKMAVHFGAFTLALRHCSGSPGLSDLGLPVLFRWGMPLCAT